MNKKTLTKWSVAIMNVVDDEGSISLSKLMDRVGVKTHVSARETAQNVLRVFSELGTEYRLIDDVKNSGRLETNAEQLEFLKGLIENSVKNSIENNC